MQEIQLRNAKFETLLAKLGELDSRKFNTVVAATDLRVTDSGLIEVTERIPGSTDGITSAFEPNDVFIGHVADTLKIGLPFARRMFAERPDVASDMVNGLWHGKTQAHDFEGREWPEPIYPPDSRDFLFRGYTEADGPATARALLSSKYKVIDNYDVVTVALNAIYNSDAKGKITAVNADLTDRRMYVRFVAPSVAVNASALLEGYRSPFEGGRVERAGDASALQAVADAANRWGGDGSTVWAGFELSNSEVGDGRFKITPRAEFKVCGNGLSIVSDLVAQTHLGARLDQGTINWSQETQKRQLALVESMTVDAIGDFLSADYWQRQIDKLAVKGGRTVQDGETVIERVGKKVGFTDAERKTIFEHFLMGGQHTAAGVMNAVTSTAQTIPNADRAAEIEALAVRALELV